MGRALAHRGGKRQRGPANFSQQRPADATPPGRTLKTVDARRVGTCPGAREYGHPGRKRPAETGKAVGIAAPQGKTPCMEFSDAGGEEKPSRGGKGSTFGPGAPTTSPSTMSLSHDPIRPLNEMLRGIVSVLTSLSAPATSRAGVAAAGTSARRASRTNTAEGIRRRLRWRRVSRHPPCPIRAAPAPIYDLPSGGACGRSAARDPEAR